MDKVKPIVIKDLIKNGTVPYNLDDEVVILKRKSNGHPRSIKDGVSYFIKGIDADGHLHVREKSGDGHGWMQPIRVHKMYMINKSVLRDIKLNSLFDETN